MNLSIQVKSWQDLGQFTVGKYAVTDRVELHSVTSRLTPGTSLSPRGCDVVRPVFGGVDRSPHLPQQQVTEEERVSQLMQGHLGSWWPWREYQVGGAVAGGRSRVGTVLG